MFGPDKLPEDPRWLNQPTVKLDPSYGYSNGVTIENQRPERVGSEEDLTLLDSPFIDNRGSSKMPSAQPLNQVLVANPMQFKFPSAGGRNVFLPIINTNKIQTKLTGTEVLNSIADRSDEGAKLSYRHSHHQPHSPTASSMHTNKA